MKNNNIAIDGPASSGKSSVAKLVAERLGYTYIDTGAMYRGVTLAVLDQKIDINDSMAVQDLLKTIEIHFQRTQDGQDLYVNGKNVSRDIRSQEVTDFVSEVSAIEAVRHHLVQMQQAMAKDTDVVMDGRDIGTVVLPDANYKFFFTASPEVRAQRRYEENMAKGISSQSLEEIKQAIIARDHYDSNREISPLKQAEDAIAVDTSHMSLNQVVDYVINRVTQVN